MKKISIAGMGMLCLLVTLILGCSKDSAPIPDGNNSTNCKALKLTTDYLTTNEPNRIEELSYDANGKLTRYKSGKTDYRFFYDSNGKVSKYSVDGYESEFIYDKDGNLTSFKNTEYLEGAVKITLSGNKVTQIVIKTNFENTIIKYSYDTKGNIIKLTGVEYPDYIIDVTYDPTYISPYYEAFQSLGACRTMIALAEGLWMLTGPNLPKETKDNVDGKIFEFNVLESKNDRPQKVRVKNFDDNEEINWIIQYECD